MTTEYIKKNNSDLDKLLRKVLSYDYKDDERTMSIKAKGLEDWEVYHNMSTERETLIIALLEELVDDQNASNKFMDEYSFLLKWSKKFTSKAAIVIGLSVSGVFGYWVTTKLETAFPQAEESKEDRQRDALLDKLLKEKYPEQTK